jgi:alginate O-acetyltransferase complex protein AlgI
VTFDLRAILVFGIAALPYAALLPARWRAWALLAGSVLAIYWLQPPLPIRYADFILPTATLLLTVASWWVTRKPGDAQQAETRREDVITLVVAAALVAGLSFMRFVEAEYRITASRPPDPLGLIAGLAIAGAALGAILWLALRRDRERALAVIGLLIIALFVILKTEPLAAAVGEWWRSLTGQDISLASGADLNWLGFSYVAFRLLHTLRDRHTGILPALSLREYMTYVVFFASYTAGPIDRAERFAGDFRALPIVGGLDAARFLDGLTRIAIGLFKKFVIADSLAQGLALTAGSAAQTDSALWLWVLLYGYAFRLYFDFSGYTDIAIGIGILFGIRLPENFDRPYLKTSLTAFWQSWHMTLSNWARFYVFTPLSRWMLTRSWKPPATLIVLAAQLATMIVIGLWHGITWSFLVWGVWHGVGLFVHKQWSDRTRKWTRGLSARPSQKRAWTAFSWFATFQFVMIGWVWFLLPDVQQAAQTVLRLFGLGW